MVAEFRLEKESLTHTRKRRKPRFAWCSLCRGNRWIQTDRGFVRCKCMKKPEGVDRKSQGAGE